MTIASNDIVFKPECASVSAEELRTQTANTNPRSVIRSPSDATVEDQMAATEYSGVLDFWDDDAEDVYGEPVEDDT